MKLWPKKILFSDECGEVDSLSLDILNDDYDCVGTLTIYEGSVGIDIEDIPEDILHQASALSLATKELEEILIDYLESKGISFRST
jgi:hypothetical protein